MTAKEIAQLIETPDKCSATDFIEIEKLTAKYPYAQTFPILLLQHLGQSKSLDFEEQLNKYAYRITDRAQLYFLINESEGKVVSEVIDPKKPIAAVEEVKEVELSIVPEEPVIEEEIIKNIAEEVIPIEEVLETSIEVLENTEEFNRFNVDINPDEDMLDFKVLEVQEMTFDPVTIDFDEDENTAIDFDERIETKVDPIELVEVETEINPIEEHTPVESELKIEEVEIDEVPDVADVADVENHFKEDESKHDQHEEQPSIGIETEQEITTITETEIRSIESFDPTVEIFAQDIPKEEEAISPSAFEEESKEISIDILSNEEDIEMDEVTSNAISAGYQITEEKEILAEAPSIEPEKETREVVENFEEKIAANKRSFTDWLKVSATTQSPEYQVKQQRSLEIVDKFIKDDPKISRFSKTEVPEKKVAEFFKVSTIAKESLNEDVMPVSETLAQIYVQQGNFGKAIDAYQQLLLLNPEKKSFFANQIKKLKKKIKS